MYSLPLAIFLMYQTASSFQEQTAFSKVLYHINTGFESNADVNGALNILRKSMVVPLLWLYCRGGMDMPARIRVF